MTATYALSKILYSVNRVAKTQFIKTLKIQNFTVMGGHISEMKNKTKP